MSTGVFMLVEAQDVLAGDQCNGHEWTALMDAEINFAGQATVLVRLVSDNSTQMRTWWDPTTELTVIRG